ncbi:hypothetical protein [Micromonospora sp. NPDC003816]|uniref:hypothetical protein n=1 Tax=Micromonospora sp. NPDC003816 TaxID=3364224 RepID=UPI0036A2E778
MEENLYVLQGVGGGTAEVWNRPGSVQRSDYSAFVQLTIDPRQMSQTCCGKGADLAVVVPEQLEMQFLQLFPVSVAVQRGADHGIQGAREVTAIERYAYLGRRR